MGFRGEDFAFESPAAAVAGMLARLGLARAEAGVSPAGACRPPEAVALPDALGRILAEDIRADRDSPPFDHAAMDGYAVRAADVLAAVRAGTGPVTLRVAGESRIGCEPPALPASADATPVAVRIATGAPLPPGADAIVKREDVTEHAEGGHGVAAVTLAAGASAPERLRPGDHVRRRGENAPRGGVVLAAGTVLSVAALGTLAAVGAFAPRVRPRLRVRVITTGDEVVPPEATPRPFEIRNSNAPALVSLLAARRWIEPTHAAHVRDAGPALRDALREALDEADAVILTGGVSMGHRDLVRAGVEDAGASVVFHGLPQRPGKPMLGAIVTRAGGTRVPVFGLPGNPISALVTATRIVMPVLAACAGVRHAHAPPGAAALVRLTNPDGRALDLWWHRLVRLTGDGRAELVDGRGSGDIIAGGNADGFVEVPPKSLAGAGGPAAEVLPFYPWAGREG
jgi:molybdopterin molybdotransferase